jgi:hypothetical protein
MKACSIYIIKFISKDPVPLTSTSLGAHVSLTRKRIPRILPRYLRDKITEGNVSIIRLTLTVLALYRVLPFKAPLKTNTITDVSEFREVPDYFISWFKVFSLTYLKIKIRDSFNPFMISSAGNSLEKIVTRYKNYG